MTTPTISEYYYTAAATDYENSHDAEYHFCNDYRYRGFLIKEYAKWLYNINECMNIWN